MIKQIITLAVAVCVTPCWAGWIHDDMAAAQKQAAEQKKGILIEFTGSDWCGPCKMMKAQVLSKQEFMDEATKNFILLELDYPRAAQPKEIKDANAALLAKYGVRGFPSVIFTDAEGNPYGGFSAVKDMAFVKGAMADALKKRDAIAAAKAKADSAASPDAKLAALVEVMAMMPKEYADNCYDDLKAQIIKLDTADKYGYAASAAQKARVKKEAEALREFRKEVVKLKDNPPAMIEKIRNFPDREKLLPDNRQTLYMMEVDFAMYMQGDVDAAIAALGKLVEIDPNTKIAKRAAQMKEYLEKNGDTIKKRVENYHKK